jgi:hypothetical protein
MLSWFRCRVLLRHRYYIYREWTQQCREIRCRCCGQRWMMHDRYQAFLPWDEELEDAAMMEADPDAWWEGRCSPLSKQ